MAGLAGRMSTVVKAKISKMLDKAEDPSETLEYSYQKQIELLQNVKKGIADVVTSKKRLQLQSQKLEQQVVKLDTQARQALGAGNEELATTKLGRAVQLAAETGNDEATAKLRKVVDVQDAEAGTVRLKKAVEKADEMALDTASTKTTRVRK